VATDFGNVKRNVLRGPRQRNVDLAVAKRLYAHGSKSVELRAEFFNLLNQVNYANPLSDVEAVMASGGSIDQTGRILTPGDFGRILYASSSPRIVQLQIRLRY
jgi:hypothetical protein